MKWMIPAACLALAACGGGESAPTQPAPQPAPVVQLSGTTFVGDSITAGWNLGPGYTNAGIAGNYTADMLARFDQVLAARPEIVVILGGTNDVRYVQNPDTRSIARMAELASASGACVILGTIPAINDWTEDTVYTTAEGNQRVAQWNFELTTIARSFGYHLADYHAVMLDSQGNFDASLYGDATVHPNAAGYAKMWPVVQAQIDACH